MYTGLYGTVHISICFLSAGLHCMALYIFLFAFLPRIIGIYALRLRLPDSSTKKGLSPGRCAAAAVDMRAIPAITGITPDWCSCLTGLPRRHVCRDRVLAVAVAPPCVACRAGTDAILAMEATPRAGRRFAELACSPRRLSCDVHLLPAICI